ncbi:MAG: J domain-containing protein, partial [Janthinobacterium sp.]
MDSGADSWLRSHWDILGTAPTGDERAIKRAYASRLKVTRPEDDPAAFQVLRQAYEYALHCAGQAHEHAHGSPAPALADQPVRLGVASSSPDAVQQATQAFLAWRDSNHGRPLES